MTNATVAEHPQAHVVRSLLHKLHKGGFELRSVHDGEEFCPLSGGITARKNQAVEAITSVDESVLFVKHGEAKSRLLLILGNGPAEIVADYSDNDTLTAVVDDFYDQWSS